MRTIIEHVPIFSTNLIVLGQGAPAMACKDMPNRSASWIAGIVSMSG
jgi:hypothetical protein